MVYIVYYYMVYISLVEQFFLIKLMNFLKLIYDNISFISFGNNFFQ